MKHRHNAYNRNLETTHDWSSYQLELISSGQPPSSMKEVHNKHPHSKLIKEGKKKRYNENLYKKS
jgi:hypothetical protein